MRRISLILLLLLMVPMTASAESPWELLETLRQKLGELGPQAANFVQTYTPAGFSTGDEETGSLAIDLPRCLRWSYGEPERKNYLICDQDVYQWNDGEAAGRQYRIDPAQEAGLDLLLVPVSTLRERYVATSEARSDGGWTIELETPSAGGGQFRATIHLSADGSKVDRLEYTDREGNRTQFAISTYREMAHNAVFRPPDGIRWTAD